APFGPRITTRRGPRSASVTSSSAATAPKRLLRARVSRVGSATLLAGGGTRQVEKEVVRHSGRVFQIRVRPKRGLAGAWLLEPAQLEASRQDPVHPLLEPRLHRFGGDVATPPAPRGFGRPRFDV